MGCELGRGVYMLVRDDIPSVLAFVAAAADSSLLWYCRLGHPSYRNLKQAIPWITVESFICKLCRLDKYHRATYTWSKLSSSQGSFDLVHCDVWALLGLRLCLLGLSIEG